jgi:ubiquinone/menaquinone biosynthesis C-methylase UbiE
VEDSRVYAIDLSCDMLDVARFHVEQHSLLDRIVLDRVDAKSLPFASAQFDVVMSNSIVHHITEPECVFAGAARVCKRGGRLFFRDLLRPNSSAEVLRLVERYAGEETDQAKRMLDDSLRAALSLAEVQTIVRRLGFPAATVSASSDRHWTWNAVNDAG